MSINNVKTKYQISSGILYLSFTLFFSVTLFSDLHGMEIVKGSACYRFSDSESIKVAREIALSMAKREALESYEVFISSTSVVENHTLKNDIIKNLSMVILKNLKINDKSENLEQRQICRSITAEISPIEMKETIQAKVQTEHQQLTALRQKQEENLVNSRKPCFLFINGEKEGQELIIKQIVRPLISKYFNPIKSYPSNGLTSSQLDSACYFVLSMVHATDSLTIILDSRRTIIPISGYATSRRIFPDNIREVIFGFLFKHISEYSRSIICSENDFSSFDECINYNQ